mmetsp:Transcript_17134/g.44539  ORF Transcript_17134/g.44539 Transcript_17134/m.44539 type:complete len:202 (-) Transcript_17134:429-1034(-)
MIKILLWGIGTSTFVMTLLCSSRRCRRKMRQAPRLRPTIIGRGPSGLRKSLCIPTVSSPFAYLFARANVGTQRWPDLDSRVRRAITAAASSSSGNEARLLTPSTYSSMSRAKVGECAGAGADDDNVEEEEEEEVGPVGTYSSSSSSSSLVSTSMVGVGTGATTTSSPSSPSSSSSSSPVSSESSSSSSEVRSINVFAWSFS